MWHKSLIALLSLIFLTTPVEATRGISRSQSTQMRNLAQRLGYPKDAKLLIVHADDLGMAHSVNRASIKGLESGLVTSASIMIPCPWLPEITDYARKNPKADLGLHLTLTSEWALFRWGSFLPASRVPSLLDGAGYLYNSESEAAKHIDPAEAEAEVRAQIARAKALGIQPTHFDSHMGTLYQSKALFEIFLRVARENKVPIRVSKEMIALRSYMPELLNEENLVIDDIISIDPGVSPENWAKYYADKITKLEPGVSEMIVHLAYDDEEMRGIAFEHPDWGSEWRQRDFQFVTSEAFRRLLNENNVKLITWREVGELLRKR